MTKVFISLVPHILEHISLEIQKRFPSVQVEPPLDHTRMKHYFDNLMGTENDPYDLVVSGYPRAMMRALQPGYGDYYTEMPHDLPGMRKELVEVGLEEPSSKLKVICLFQLILVYNSALEQPVKAWRDLCRQDLRGKVVIPPPDTPVPDFFHCLMRNMAGDNARDLLETVNQRLYPWDINQALVNREYLAGLNIPLLAKQSHGGKVAMAWPQEGAAAQPTCAMLKKDAHEDALGVLHYLLSSEAQTYLSLTGEYCPVIPQAPLFEAMLQNQGRMWFAGWDAHLKLGDY
jgi:hypothetical protein